LYNILYNYILNIINKKILDGTEKYINVFNK